MSVETKVERFSIRGTEHCAATVCNAPHEAAAAARGACLAYAEHAQPTQFVPAVPIRSFRPSLYAQRGESHVCELDLADVLRVPSPATSPALRAAFVVLAAGDARGVQQRELCATSHVLFCVRGHGETRSARHGTFRWHPGDYLALPHDEQLQHVASGSDGAVLYYVSDAPLLRFLGVAPRGERFAPVLFRHAELLRHVERVSHAPGVEHKNRCGILLEHVAQRDTTKTVTPVMWSLLNVLPRHDHQRPHKHQSVALDLCVVGPREDDCGKVYTLIGRELDENGWIVDPVKVYWIEGGAFVTPPGLWHSHHNESDTDAFVLPVQDAGLHHHLRSLDITFTPDKDTLPDEFRIPPHLRANK